jgi:hypothetical protein
MPPLSDARSALTYAAHRFPPQRAVLWGYSRQFAGICVSVPQRPFQNVRGNNFNKIGCNFISQVGVAKPSLLLFRQH